MKIKNTTKLISAVAASLAMVFCSHASLMTVTENPAPATNSPPKIASPTNSPDILGKIGNSTNVWGDFSFWTGAKFSSPYTINGTTKTLTPTGNKTDGYLEIKLISRYVLRHGSLADDPVLGDDSHKTPKDGRIHWVDPFVHMPDFNASLGYLFRGSSGPTNFNASTVVGSSDFYVDASVGLPLLRYNTDNETNWNVKQQVSLEFGDGFATDKNFLQLHHNAFVGLGWQGGFAVNGNQQAYWFGRAGYAEIDQPVLVSGTGTVKFNALNQPVFEQKWVPSTGVIVVYPLTSAINLQAGVNSYYSHNPANWNASLGLSFDLTKLTSFFKSATN